MPQTPAPGRKPPKEVTWGVSDIRAFRAAHRRYFARRGLKLDAWGELVPVRKAPRTTILVITRADPEENRTVQEAEGCL